MLFLLEGQKHNESVSITFCADERRYKEFSLRLLF